jgi:serine protease Do
MKCDSRPFFCIASRWVAAAGCAVLLATTPAWARAQAQQITPVFIDSSTQAATQGYLGIDIADLNAGKMQALKLKDTNGAVITLIDHDAPAGQAGLKVDDVVLQMDGQAVQNADQFRQMLRKVPAGGKIALQISRDGNLHTVNVQLVDRKQMEKKVWTRLGSAPAVPTMGILSGDSLPSGFHLPSFGSTLKVGALVEPLTSQMAAYLGVESGLMVKQVARRSAAAVAGLRAFDVILKVGSEAIATSADWERALRTNQGKPVQVTILRDKKQQTLTMQVDSKRHRSALEDQQMLGPASEQTMAELRGLDAEISRQINAQALAAAEAARAREKALRQQLSSAQLTLPPGQSAQLRHEAERLRACMKNFRPDPQQMERLRRQMEEFRRDFPSQEFRLSGRQLQELQQQMQQFREQMQEWSARAAGRFV